MILNGKSSWLKIFQDLKEKGKVCSPRGEKILEIEDYHIDFHPINDRFCSFKERNLDLAYLCGEFAWYLSGDRNNLSIIDYSKFWNKVKNPEMPYFNSNYGYYLFAENQLKYVIDTLVIDKDSRQACIMINRAGVMLSKTNDKLCTNSIMFRIRDNKLNMSVQMRSNDAIFGLGIDACMFSFVYEMVYTILKQIAYKDLEIGVYHHTASSFHIYERHWGMLDEILKSNGENYVEIDCPEMEYEEVVNLQRNLPKLESSIRCGGSVKTSYKFTKFLTDKLTEKWQKK